MSAVGDNCRTCSCGILQLGCPLLPGLHKCSQGVTLVALWGPKSTVIGRVLGGLRGGFLEGGWAAGTGTEGRQHCWVHVEAGVEATSPPPLGGGRPGFHVHRRFTEVPAGCGMTCPVTFSNCNTWCSDCGTGGRPSEGWLEAAHVVASLMPPNSPVTRVHHVDVAL
jgi:hypothetical protein